MGANSGGMEGMYPSNNPAASPPNIFHGSGKFPIRCIVSLPNQDARALIMQTVLRKSVLSAAFFVSTAIITNLHPPEYQKMINIAKSFPQCST